MSYEIVKGVPPPPPKRAAWSPEREAMERMEVGDHFIVGDPSRVDAARWAQFVLKPKKFIVQKQADGSGWGVWRTE